MVHQKNKNLYVVRDGNYMRDDPYEELSIQGIGEENGQYKSNFLKKAFIGATALAIIAAAVYLHLIRKSSRRCSLSIFVSADLYRSQSCEYI